MFNIGKTEEESGRLKAMEENFAVISFKPDGTILHANDNFLNVLGYKLNETVGNHHRMFCEKKYVNTKEYADFWNNLNKGISQINEFERIRKDGSSVWIQASYTPVKDKNGKVTRVVKFAQDITEAKKVIDAVKKAIELAKTGIMKQTITESTKNEGIEELKNGVNDLFEIVSTKVDGDLNRISDALLSFQKLNFAHRITGNNLGEVSEGLNSLANVVNDMLVENKSNGLTLDASSDILLANVDKLNVSSNEAAASLEETAAALEEITSIVKSSVQKVHQMSSLATQLQASSKEGEILASRTTKAMDDIDNQVRSINDAITVIDQIAFQTNILSLNAAVEAATAGEAGKGFAVVAAEVRNLANRSADAAKEIKNIVQIATSKANEGKSIANEMIGGYATLNAKVNETISLIEDVSQGSKEEEKGIIQINDTINKLDQATQVNANSATIISELANEVTKLSENLLKIADRAKFKEASKEEIEDIDLVFKISKLKNDHIRLKLTNFEKIGKTKVVWTVSKPTECDLGKWLVEEENLGKLFTKTENWKVLKSNHDVVHNSVQEYINEDCKDISNKDILNTLSQTLDDSTAKVFKCLDQIKKDNADKKSISELNTSIKIQSTVKTETPKSFVQHKHESTSTSASKQIISQIKKEDEEWESF